MNLELFHFFNNLAQTSPFTQVLVIFLATHLATIALVFTFGFLVFSIVPRHIRKREIFFTRKVYTIIRERVSRNRAFALTLILSPLVSWVLVKILKALIHFPRPHISIMDFSPLFFYGSFESFPSGHAVIFASLATAMTLYHRKIGLVYILVAILIGISRIAAGIHFPVDVLAGYAIGVLLTLAIYYSVEQSERPSRVKI